MICEVCSNPEAEIRTLDVRWPSGELSIPGVWSAWLCEPCIPAFVERMRQKAIEISVK